MTTPGLLLAAVGGAALMLGGAVVWARRNARRARGLVDYERTNP